MASHTEEEILARYVEGAVRGVLARCQDEVVADEPRQNAVLDGTQDKS
jgi:phage gp36-like protein